MKVLVAEEINFVRSGIVRCLTNAGFLDVDQVNNGQAAVTRALSNNYALLIISQRLSKLTGMEAVNEINEARKEKVPIILMASNPSKQFVLEAMSLGVSSIISTPINENHLILKIQSILDGKTAQLEKLQYSIK